MGATDALLARLQGEIEERSTFIDNLVEGAEKDKRDLTEQEMTLLARTRDRIGELNKQVDPLREAAQIATDSRATDRGDRPAVRRGPRRSSRPSRTSTGPPAATSSTSGAPAWASPRPPNASTCTSAPPPTRRPATTRACCREQMLEPVINFIDAARPLVTALGPRQLPSGSLVAAEDHPAHQRRPAGRGEDRARQPQDDHRHGARHRARPTAATSTCRARTSTGRRRRSWTSSSTTWPRSLRPGDGEGAVRSRSTPPTTGGPIIPTGAATPAAVNAAAIWAAVGDGVRRDQGRRAGSSSRAQPRHARAVIGPGVPAVNPTNASVAGVQRRRDSRQGQVGAISGLPVVVSAGFDAGTVHRPVDRRGRGVRGPHRLPAGRRTVRAGRAGRLRRLLRRR